LVQILLGPPEVNDLQCPLNQRHIELTLPGGAKNRKAGFQSESVTRKV